MKGSPKSRQIPLLVGLVRHNIATTKRQAKRYVSTRLPPSGDIIIILTIPNKQLYTAIIFAFGSVLDVVNLVTASVTFGIWSAR